MLDLRDPRVETVLTWFRHCYDVDVSPSGRPYWRRTALPGDGGMGEQDAWLMNGLEFVATVHQALLEEGAKRRSSELKRQTNG